MVFIQPYPFHIYICEGVVPGPCVSHFISSQPVKPLTEGKMSSGVCFGKSKAFGFCVFGWMNGTKSLSSVASESEIKRISLETLDIEMTEWPRPLHTLRYVRDPHRHRVRLPSAPSAVPDWVDGPATNPRTIGTPETTAQVHPQLFTRKLVAVAEAEHGLEVVIGELDHVAVDGGGRATGAALKDGRVIAADAVVLALGPWSGRLSMLNSLFRVYGLKAHSIVLEPNEPSVITPHALFLSYYSSHGGRPMDPEVYPRPTGEVYVCGMSSEAQVPDDPEGIVGDVESIKVLKRVAGTVSSLLKEGEARVKAEQACFLPCTDDNKPVIGEIPGVRRCYVATGHSCWGILNGPATGAAMAELVLDGKSSIVDITPFSPARFVGGGSRRRY
ncbi:hypothetical protein Scep_001020 [Stephania cephalantha]|uniref:FAD dependent oxidoreductase domain-containing protein n=1 Tax=Stephania cephalantha TaxID=152367 RepID=A0AAP0LAZ2_9MAGN